MIYCPYARSADSKQKTTCNVGHHLIVSLERQSVARLGEKIKNRFKIKLSVEKQPSLWADRFSLED